MATQLELWNLAASHIGNTEQIVTLQSRQRAAVECAKFEAIARGIVMSEYPWSFSNAEALLVDSVPVEDITGLVVHESVDAELWMTPENGGTNLVAGDEILINGTAPNGYTFEDYVVYGGADTDGNFALVDSTGANAYTAIDILTGGTLPGNNDTIALVSGTVQKKPVSDRWAYQYDLPDNYLAARCIYSTSYMLRPDAPPMPFEIAEDNDQRVLLTDLQDPILVYTKDSSSYALLPPTVLLALSYKLAELIAFAVTRDEEIEKKVATQYQRALHSAIEKDANAQKPDLDPRGESMREGFTMFMGSDNW